MNKTVSKKNNKKHRKSDKQELNCSSAEVTCPPPDNIERGYMSNNERREFDYMERVKYDCRDNYVLEGNVEIVCQENGRWSDLPSCKGEEVHFTALNHQTR